LNADSIAIQILKPLLVKFGKKWDNKSANKIVGRTPLEVAAVVVENYQLPYSAEEFLSMTTPLFADQ
jgi:riboflavin kinase / FMN hydrolase